MESANSGQIEPQSGSSHLPPQPSEPSDKHEKAPDPGLAVRFASEVEEIDSTGHPNTRWTKDALTIPGPNVTPDQIKALSSSLQGVRLQEQRMKNYSFQPFSLPPSRVPSNEDLLNATPQQSHTPTGTQSPRMSPGGPDVVSPPLTPSGTSGPESSSHGSKPAASQPDGAFEPTITPQASGQESAPGSPRIGLQHRPASFEDGSHRTSDDRDGASSHRRAMFSIGPGGSSVPVSRESSPSRNSASQFYTRPFTPAGDANDPYAASKRAPQTKAVAPGTIDPRFVFNRKRGRVSPATSTTSLPRIDKADKRHSFLGVLNKSNHDLQQTGTQSTIHSRNTSMSDLKRFFKIGAGSKVKKTSSPDPSKPPSPTTVAPRLPYAVPFADGLSSKYGKIGKVLGSGAGGSVKLMKRSEDSTVFAVKEFRPRHPYETEKEYVKKLTAEFCVGSALHHGNIIETLDIMTEKGKWYEVMEYAPYDLFAIVMSGKSSKAEVTCDFLQILSGVTYLHSMGLAHRDLKLDNVVVSEHGIMKIIDFGSAHVFKYPFESDIVLATGVVGSDPYLAPEVYDERKYDPQGVDIWSLAIIFACMTIRRFPWKVPRLTDNSFKLFAAEPTPGHDPKKLIVPSHSASELADTPHRDIFPEDVSKPHKHGNGDDHGKPDQPMSPTSPAKASSVSANKKETTRKDASGKEASGTKEIIRGPWRLLRSLPRESRHIISRMLVIDPRQRAKMAEILEDPWVSESVICREIAPGQVISGDNHTHVLESPAAVASTK